MYTEGFEKRFVKCLDRIWCAGGSFANCTSVISNTPPGLTLPTCNAIACQESSAPAVDGLFPSLAAAAASAASEPCSRRTHDMVPANRQSQQWRCQRATRRHLQPSLPHQPGPKPAKHHHQPRNPLKRPHLNHHP